MTITYFTGYPIREEYPNSNVLFQCKLLLSNGWIINLTFYPLFIFVLVNTALILIFWVHSIHFSKKKNNVLFIVLFCLGK